MNPSDRFADAHASRLGGDPVPGMMLGEFLLGNLLGEGAFGLVFAATRAGDGQRVAIKVLKEKHRDDSEVYRRFWQEAQMAGRVRHVNIVEVYNIGCDQGVIYFPMEFLEGETLKDRMKPGRAVMTLTEVADIAVPVALALQCIHEAGFVHRDLKPANIFLCRGANGMVVPKILDFGIVKDLDPERRLAVTQMQAHLGTPAYMSPEQVQGAASVAASSDQFSLGVVLYQCLTGSRPYPGNRFEEIFCQMLTDNPVLARHHVPDLPEFVEQVLHRMVRRDPHLRFAHMGEVANAFMRYASPAVRADFADEFSVTKPSFREEIAHDAPEFEYAMRSLDEAVPSLGALETLNAAWNRIAKEPPAASPYVSSWEPRRWWPLWSLLALVFAAVVAAAATVREPTELVRRNVPPALPQPPRASAPAREVQTPLQPAAPADVAHRDASEEHEVARDAETPRAVPQVLVDAAVDVDRSRNAVRRSSRQRIRPGPLDDLFH